jgi:hypothetical protein
VNREQEEGKVNRKERNERKGRKSGRSEELISGKKTNKKIGNGRRAEQ